MKIIRFAAAALALLSLGGCQALQGLHAVNTALIPQLKPLDVKIHTDMTCSQLAANVLAQTTDVARQLSPQQVLAIVQFCEQRDATQMLQIDPQGARQALDAVVAKAASPAGAVGAVAALPK